MWKDIKGFENYKISDDGRIISKEFVNTYKHKRKDGSIKIVSRTLKERELSLWNCNGYPAVELTNGSKKRKTCVHVLVAETFLEKPEWAECVNHKDGNKIGRASCRERVSPRV